MSISHIDIGSYVVNLNVGPCCEVGGAEKHFLASWRWFLSWHLKLAGDYTRPRFGST
jgi:hypothetical protein